MSAEYGIAVMPVPFELRPALSPEGVSGRERGLRHSERVEEHVRHEAATFGRTISIPDHIPNTHLAMALGEHARDAGEHIFRRLHERIFETYYEEGRDIGSREVLLELAEEVGLDPREVETAWAEHTYDDRLHQIQHLAGHLGIVMTPSALICTELLVGSRPYGLVRQSVERCLRRFEESGKGPTDSAEASNR